MKIWQRFCGEIYWNFDASLENSVKCWAVAGVCLPGIGRRRAMCDAWVQLVRAAVFRIFLCALVVLLSSDPESVGRAESRDASRTADKSLLESVERTIGREPKYSGTPRYALMVLGADAKTKVWMVEDGDVLYVDKNANGDLTDDGPPISQSDVREWDSGEGTSRDCNYLLEAITPADGAKHTDFNLRRWKYGKAELSYGLSLSLDGKVPMYAGWFGTFWAAKPADVPKLHFGGRLIPAKLSGKQFILGSTPEQLDTAFIKDGSGKGARSYLSIDAMPKDVVPEVHIDWPVSPSAAPVRTVERLTERCCYWNYYKKGFQIPEGIVEGEAVLTFVIPDGAMPLELATNKITVPVRAAAK